MSIKRMKKKLLAMLMIMLMCIPLSGTVTANAASSDYRSWAQWDSEWGSIHLGKSQYTMKSSGSIIIACDNGTDMVNALNEEGIPAVIIGRTTDNNGKILRNEDEIRYLDKM